MARNNGSVKPGNENSLTGILKTIQDLTSKNIENMLPARVINFDRAANRVTVQPIIRVLGANGQTISRNRLASIPVYNPSGGGFGMYFPLVQGSLGWINANDRDISLFLQSYNESNPNTTRKHSFSDAVFYPDMMTGFNISEEDNENFTLQNSSGTQKIVLNKNGDILLKTTAKITLDAAGGVKIISPTLTHNNVDISETHGHPQGNDSDGNSEQDTGTPITVG